MSARPDIPRGGRGGFGGGGAGGRRRDDPTWTVALPQMPGPGVAGAVATSSGPPCGVPRSHPLDGADGAGEEESEAEAGPDG